MCGSDCYALLPSKRLLLSHLIDKFADIFWLLSIILLQF